MINTLSTLLNSAQAPFLLKGLKILFLILFALTLFPLILQRHSRTGKPSFALLRFLFSVFAVLLLCNQTFWQLFGFNHPRFARFLRRYNQRPNAAELQVLRGPILDRRGFVLAAPIPGKIWARRYPLGNAGVHPIGYYHPSFGITSIERIMDAPLSGYLSEQEINEAPLSGRLLAKRAYEGKEVYLTLDSRLQRFTYEQFKGKPGGAIVMEAQTGNLLALVSSPGFDPLHPAPALRDTATHPAFNRATQGRYPPGSTFKLLMAALAIDCGKALPLDCPGTGYRAGPGTPPIRDSEFYAYARRGAVWPGWGTIGIKEALVHSSNVYFARVGVLCGTEAFQEWMHRAQINDAICYATGVSGTLKTAKGSVPAYEKPRQLAQPAIGQGALLVTPMHIACITAAFARDGTMPVPNLLRDSDTPPARPLCSQRAARLVRAAMREVVTRGTGRGINLNGLSVCGKTGTAQAAQGEDHAWFTCFAPQKNPRIVVTVLVEHGGFGAKSALPIARAILSEAQRLNLLTQPTHEK